MARFIINVEGMSNSPPYMIGELYLNVQAPETYVFTSDDFEVNTIPQYADIENDNILKIKITRINTNNQGLITVNDVVVEEGDEILMSDIINGSMVYTSNPTQDEMGNDYFYFDVADTGSQEYGNLEGSININVLAVQNLPPTSVGDGEATVLDDSIIVFTEQMFTATNPAYSDPESDPPGRLKILSLPQNGSILLRGIEVQENEIIYFDEIRSGELIFQPNDVDETTIDSFEFQIADVGSNIFVG